MELTALCQLAEGILWLEERKEQALPVQQAARDGMTQCLEAITEKLNSEGSQNQEWLDLTNQCIQDLKVPKGISYLNSLGIWLRNYEKKLGLMIIKELTGGQVPSCDQSKIIGALLVDSEIETKIKALGLYTNAACQDFEDPLFSYYFMSLAFQLDHTLAQEFGVDYEFRPGGLRESYAERCPICGCEESAPYFCVKQFSSLTKDEKFFSPVKLWTKCSKCHNLYAYNFPINSMGTINGHYTKNASMKGIRPNISLHIYGDIINRCGQYTTGREYLEIGIGNGGMLATAMELGYHVDAVEICKEDCELVSGVLGVDIKWADVLDCEFERTYDIVIMGDVLEHVSRPVEALRKAYECLNPSGVLFLSTPNFNSGFTRMMKFHDPMMNQKNHFTYFSYEGLKPILEELGFSVEHYDVSKRYNGSMELYCVKK